MSMSDQKTDAPDPDDGPLRVDRRSFLQRSSLILAGVGCEMSQAAQRGSAESPTSKPPTPKPAVRFGLLTDTHYADKPPAGTRHYRESLDKIREGITAFNRGGVSFAVELGDFIDAAKEVPDELAYLAKLEAVYATVRADRHYVLGNHCCWTLTKPQFFDHCGAKKPFYSFDRNGFHFVILDACYRADGVSYGGRNYEWTDTDIPPAEREWLAADLDVASGKTVVFVHQRLDVKNHYGVKSGPAVRKILEESGKVLAVFQGHNHINEHKYIGGIHYCTLAAMVEGAGPDNSAYSVVDIYPDSSLRVDGFHKQTDYAWPPQ